MQVGVVQRAVEVEGFWRVEVVAGEYEVAANQLVEQIREGSSLVVWEVVQEEGSTLVLDETGLRLVNGILMSHTGREELRPGDVLDVCVGGRVAHLGLGDVIAGVTKAIGIEPCQGCEERRQKLNRLFPKVLKK